VAGLAVAAAVVLLVVFALGRAGAGGESTMAARSPRSAIPGVGPARSVDGLPAGYSHTRAEAMAAALNYIGVFGNPEVMFNAARLRQALSVLVTPQLAHETMAAYRRAGGQLAKSSLVRGVRASAPAIAMGVPVAYRVLRSSADRLRAEFWTVAVVGNLQGIAPHSLWGRTTVTLGWVQGDWKLIAQPGRQAGPTPTLGSDQQTTEPATFVDQLRGFRDFRYVP
jgi:hypothetical protein